MNPVEVLIVEDNELDAELVVRALARGNVQARPRFAEDRASLARALAEPPRPDLVLSDHSLPGLDSLGVLRAVRAAGCDAPVLIVSGVVGEDALAQAMQEGVAGYVSKDKLGSLASAAESALAAAATRRAKDALERDLSRFFALSADYFAVLDLAGRFRLMNGAWTATFPRTETELRQEGFLPLLHEADRETANAAVAALAKGAPVTGLETRLLARDGTYRTLLWHATSDPHEGAMYAVARDVTAAKAQEAAARRQERLAAVGVLAAGVAHEINNPLTYVLTNAELLRIQLAHEGDSPEMPARCRVVLGKLVESVDVITKGVRRIADIAAGLRAVARPAQATREKVDVNALAAGVLRAVPVPKSAGVKIATDYRATRRAFASPSQVEQVVLTLLVNAVEAASASQAPEVRIATADAEIGVEIAVADNGPGIGPDVASKIFTPLFTTKPMGTGLALAVSLAIAKDHGGSLTVESEPGRGATFKLVLPAAAD